MTGKDNAAVAVRFFLPPDQLRSHVSAIYLTEIPSGAPNPVIDWLMPEWASLRMAERGECLARIGREPARLAPRIMLSGPSSHATRVELGPIRIWGIGILPLGWARLIGASAADYADRFWDCRDVPELGMLPRLFDAAFPEAASEIETAGRIAAALVALFDERPADAREEARIVAAHQLLLDERISSVADFAARLGMSTRSLERFCLRVFGFSPKLLLRRQRFTRSLARFLLDPSMAWIQTLDDGYVDQAHFVRDFKRFMGMNPSVYAAADRLILKATAQPRASQVGGAIQALHRPEP